MSIEGILASAIIFIIGVMWLAHPFRNQANIHSQLMKQQDRQSLLNAYERLLGRLRDLDEDFNLGKMPEADYQQERAQLAEKGAALLAKIEQSLGKIDGAQPTSKPSKDADAVLDAAIESAIASYIATTQDEKNHETVR